MPKKASTKKSIKTVKKPVGRPRKAVVSKRPAGKSQSSARFYTRKAPELPFWIFLVLGAMALVILAGVYLSKSTNKAQKALSSLSAISPISLIPPIAPTTPTKTLLKTITEADATDPTLVPFNDQLYLVFGNSLGGYSVTTYDQALNEIKGANWITNGLQIPGQQVAAPAFYNTNWYLAYLGGDGFVRLSKFDQNWNRQREITFATPLKFATRPVIGLCVNEEAATIKIYDATTKHLFTATPDMGIRRDEDAASANWPYNPCQPQSVTIGDKTYDVSATSALQNGNLTVGQTTPGSTVTINLYQTD